MEQGMIHYTDIYRVDASAPPFLANRYVLKNDQENFFLMFWGSVIQVDGHLAMKRVPTDEAARVGYVLRHLSDPPYDEAFVRQGQKFWDRIKEIEAAVYGTSDQDGNVSPLFYSDAEAYLAAVKHECKREHVKLRPDILRLHRAWHIADALKERLDAEEAGLMG